MTEKETLETYAKVILHSGCALNEEVTYHTFEKCQSKELHLVTAKRHQSKLKKLGLAIGIWINESEFNIVPKV